MHERRFLLYGQACLVLGIVACIFIDPSYAQQIDQGGISNYGTQASTIFPYTLGFLLAGVSALLHAERNRVLPGDFLYFLRLIGWLYLISAVTTLPYQVNEFWRSLHELSTVVLFLVAVAGSVRLFINVKRTLAVTISFSVMMLGFTVVLSNYFGNLTLLLVGEVVSLIGFAIFLIIIDKQLSKTG